MNDEIAKMIAEEKALESLNIDVNDVDNFNAKNEIITKPIEITEVEEKLNNLLTELSDEQLDKLMTLDPRFKIEDIEETANKRMELLASKDESTIDERVRLKSKYAIRKEKERNRKLEAQSKVDKSIDKADLEKAYKVQQNEYYCNHKDVLQFARMDNPHSLSHMKFIYWLMIPLYTLLEILHGLAAIAGGVISLINVFFENAFGKKIDTGKPDKDGNTIYKIEKINLATRILIICGLVIVGLFVLFALIDEFTGFNIIEVLNNYTKIN